MPGSRWTRDQSQPTKEPRFDMISVHPIIHSMLIKYIQEGQGKPLAPSTIETAYVSALCSLWEDQCLEGKNAYPHPRGPLVGAFLEDLKIERYSQQRAAFEDRAIAGLQDGYNLEQLQKMLDAQLRWPKEKSWAEAKALRTRLDLLLMHSMMLRSETTRSAELPDFSSLGLPNEGEPAFAVILTQNKGKTIEQAESGNASTTRYNGFLRAKTALACPVGALAQWLVYRWDIFGEEPPNFADRSSWYTAKIIPGDLKKPAEEISSQTEAKWVDRTFDGIALVSSKLLHTMRKSVSRLMDFLELPWDQVKYFLLNLSNSSLVRFCFCYTLLTHSGRSCEREAGSREH
jgi:hypothetical protein